MARSPVPAERDRHGQEPIPVSSLGRADSPSSVRRPAPSRPKLEPRDARGGGRQVWQCTKRNPALAELCGVQTDGS